MKSLSYFIKIIPLTIFLFTFTFAQDSKDFELLKPQTGCCLPIIEALKKIYSSRSYSSKMLEPQILSNLLWAAFGINRSSGKRTAPSYRNLQEIDVYLIMEKGVYLYNPKLHSLDFISKKDLRTIAGVQEYVQTAPINLIYVADKKRSQDLAKEFLYADTGYISQNVYLFCASEGLSTSVRAYIDKNTLAKEMNLESSQEIILGQTVGYPK